MREGRKGNKADCTQNQAKSMRQSHVLFTLRDPCKRLSETVDGAVFVIWIPLQLECLAVRICDGDEQSAGLTVTPGAIGHDNLIAWSHAVLGQARSGEAPQARAFE